MVCTNSGKKKSIRKQGGGGNGEAKNKALVRRTGSRKSKETDDTKETPDLSSPQKDVLASLPPPLLSSPLLSSELGEKDESQVVHTAQFEGKATPLRIASASVTRKQSEQRRKVMDEIYESEKLYVYVLLCISFELR